MNSCAVVGGQFGSEGKGLIVAHIANQYPIHVRVGAANAGHTFYDALGTKRVTQQIPIGAFINPNADIYIGPGALISPEIFHKEIDTWQAYRLLHGFPPKQVFVDARAHVISVEHIAVEADTDLAERIGSTSTIAREGIGAAQAARVMREESCILAANYYDDPEWFSTVRLCDAPDRLFGEPVLLEGTQGTGLSLTTGAFPYVTSRNTTVAGLCADAGFAPNQVDRRIMVCRTFPIRVAGPSGPFWHDSNEISWDQIGVSPDSERTTVTRKIRRVATFSYDQLHEAAVLNMPTEIALTFTDYLDPAIASEGGKMPVDTLRNEFAEIWEMVDRIITITGVPVTMLGTGPKTIVELDYTEV